MIKETPILFTAALLPLTLDGRKVETRRLPRKLPKWATPDSMHVDSGKLYAMEGGVSREIPCPYGKAGDLLHCGEVLVPKYNSCDDAHAIYERDGAEVRPDGFPIEWRWKVNKLTSMYTPKAYRRIWHEVLESRAEHLQDITVGSMIREGLKLPSGVEPAVAVDAWTALWDSINAKRGYPCSDDPIVWMVRFRCVSTTGKPAGVAS